MKIKLNIELDKNIFNKNGVNFSMRTPAELISICIPRWNSLSQDLFSKDHKINEINCSLEDQNILSIYSFDLHDICVEHISSLFVNNFLVMHPNKNYYYDLIKTIGIGLTCAHEYDMKKSILVSNFMNDNSDIFKDLIELSDNMIEYISGKSKYPYQELIKFLDISDSIDNLKIEIENIKIRFNHAYIEDSIYIKEKYNSIKDVLIGIIAFSIIYQLNNKSIIDIINCNRKSYGYIPFANSSKYSDIVNKHKQNYITNLNLIVNIGIKFYYIYYVIRYYYYQKKIEKTK
jgi:hypothetical protein